MFISCYVSIPQCQVRFLATSRHLLTNVAGYQTSVLSSQPVAVNSQLQQIVLPWNRDRLKIDVSKSGAMYSEGVQHLRDGVWPPGETSPGLFRQTYHLLHRQDDTSRDQIACSQIDTPPPPQNYKSINLWYILIAFLLPQNSLSSSSLFSTFILFISIIIINIYYFLSQSYFSTFYRFLPILYLLTPLSSVLSSLSSSQISVFIIKISFSYSFCLYLFNLYLLQQYYHILLCIPFPFPSTSYPLR
jgi:hypothetical protein